MFDFYIAADAILRDEERRWYGFEIAEVIEHGEFARDHARSAATKLLRTRSALSSSRQPPGKR